MTNLALVGEMNPYGADPRYALYHEPRNASGDRLRRILGLSVRSYVPIQKYNLCVGSWSMASARARAGEIWEAHDLIITLGARVRSAFNQLIGTPGCSGVGVDLIAGHTLVALPHPSGLCRAWNVVENVVDARHTVQQYTGLPCGEIEEYLRAAPR